MRPRKPVGPGELDDGHARVVADARGGSGRWRRSIRHPQRQLTMSSGRSRRRAGVQPELRQPHREQLKSAPRTRMPRLLNRCRARSRDARRRSAPRSVLPRGSPARLARRHPPALEDAQEGSNTANRAVRIGDHVGRCRDGHTTTMVTSPGASACMPERHPHRHEDERELADLRHGRNRQEAVRLR